MVDGGQLKKSLYRILNSALNDYPVKKYHKKTPRNSRANRE
jgi:hypothetical protein